MRNHLIAYAHRACGVLPLTRGWRTVICPFLLGLSLSAAPVQAQDPEAGSSPAAGAPPWRMLVPLSDGRTFITNGQIAIDVELSGAENLPDTVAAASAGAIEGWLAASRENEFDLAELRTGVGPSDSANYRNYTAPSGVVLSAIYVDYLRRTLPGRRLRVRMGGEFDPAVILLDGTAVAVVMPVRGRRP